MSTIGKLWRLLIVLAAVSFGYRNVAKGDLTSYVAKWKGNSQAALSITVDDNGGDMRNLQALILEEYGVRGTFNIITGPLASYAHYQKQMFLDIFNRGHELGSHSVTHPFLIGESTDFVWSELSESKRFIEELTGAPCVTYAAPYGQLGPNIVEVARELYISARGVEIGINEIAEGSIWNLKIAPYPTPWGSTWTNEQYLTNLRQYVEDILAVGGWGIEMWHNLTTDPNTLNSGQQVNESMFRAHLADLTLDYGHRLWIATQGQVARYCLERKETKVNSYAVTDNVILIELLFDGDRGIFNEPLTVVTTIPERWLNHDLRIMQQSSILDYIVEQDQTESRLVYDALPGAGAISIVFDAHQALTGDLDRDGDVDAGDFTIFAAHWLGDNKK